MAETPGSPGGGHGGGSGRATAQQPAPIGQGRELVFQPGQSKGLDATFHFDFTGADPCQATVIIRGERVKVSPGLEGRPDLVVSADGPTWVAYLSGQVRLFPALLRRRSRIKGPFRTLRAFSRCFPG